MKDLVPRKFIREKLERGNHRKFCLSKISSYTVYCPFVFFDLRCESVTFDVGMCDIYQYTDNIDTKITIVIAIVDFIYRYFYAC